MKVEQSVCASVKKIVKAVPVVDDSNVCEPFIGADIGWDQVIDLMVHVRDVARGVCKVIMKKTYRQASAVKTCARLVLLNSHRLAFLSDFNPPTSVPWKSNRSSF